MATRTDPEVEFYQKQVCDFVQQQFDKLSYRERLFIREQAIEIVNDLRKINQYSRLTVQDVLVIAIYTCYYQRFKESPIETAILHQ